MTTTKQSLCKLCSNLVVIKLHGRNIKQRKKYSKCYFDFFVEVTEKNKYDKNDYSIRASSNRVIVDQCSFYDKPITLKPKKKKIKDEDNSDDSADSNRPNEVIDPMNFTDLKCREVLREEGRK